MKAVGVAGALALLGGTAAGDEHEEPEEPEEPPTEVPDAGQAAVSVAHLSPDAPNVDVLVDGDAVLEDVAYGDVSDYLVVDAGTYQVTITAAGDPDTVAFEGDVTFDPTYYTVAAIGELDAGTFQPLVLPDYDVAQVRLVHAAPDAPAVDVTVQDANLALFENVSFGQDSDYVAVPPGSYTLEVRAAEPHNMGDIVETFEVEVESGKAYSGYAIGYLDAEMAGEDRPLDLRVVLDGVTAHVDFDAEPPMEEDVREDEPEVDEEDEPDVDDDEDEPEVDEEEDEPDVDDDEDELEIDEDDDEPEVDEPGDDDGPDVGDEDDH